MSSDETQELQSPKRAYYPASNRKSQRRRELNSPNRPECAHIQRSASSRPRYSETKSLRHPESRTFWFPRFLHTGSGRTYCCAATESRPKNRRSCYRNPCIPRPCEDVPEVEVQSAASMHVFRCTTLDHSQRGPPLSGLWSNLYPKRQYHSPARTFQS